MFEKSKRSKVVDSGDIYRIRDSNCSGNIQDNENGGMSMSIESDSGRRIQYKPKSLSITVVFLDNSQNTFILEKSAKGSVLLDLVFQHLELVEKDYFGLQFDELLPPPEVSYPLNNPHLRWIESSKLLKKQLRFTKPTQTSKKYSIYSTAASSTASDSNSFQDKSKNYHIPSATVYFRVKFFIEDPSRFNEEYTRYHIFLQVRKDINEGRLNVTPSTACLLASYAAQSEMGDFNNEEHDMFGDYLKNISELTSLRLCSSSMEELTEKTCQLHKLHQGQSPADAELNYLDHAKKLEGYGVCFHRAKDNGGKEINIGISANGISVYHNNVRINIFSWPKITKLAFKRKNFFLQLKRELSEDYDTLLIFDTSSYKSCKSLWKCGVEAHGFFRLSEPPPPNRRPNIFLGSFGSKFRYSGRTEYQTRETSSTRNHREKKNFFRSQSKKLQFFRQTIRGLVSDKENIRKNIQDSDDGCCIDENINKIEVKNLSSGSKNGNSRAYDNKIQSTKIEPKKAWIENHSPTSNGGFEKCNQSSIIRTVVATHNSIFDLPGKIPFADADADENSISDDGTLSIILEADMTGKFGFNIKGGSGSSVLVSRVAPKSPADLCYPRLSEGDFLIQINGQTTETMSHNEVVSLIRNAALSKNKELHLRVRQNIYSAEDFDNDEPPFSYQLDVPDIPLLHNNNVSSHQGVVQNALVSSMLLLSEAIDSNQISSQFELVRRNNGSKCDIAKLPENVTKNRYRDILPYDSTRVKLNNCPSGDYINANLIEMEIPSGIINRYIATQGPLASTTIDFWIMVWESQSPLIVMLTPIYERGRIKCHQYWPQQLNSSTTYHTIKVILTKEKDLTHWTYREFLLKHSETDEERVVTQYQFVDWPDHGIPDIDTFIKFIEEVRKAKSGFIEPIIIHCSAGIGRTGVLILMETAQCLIECNNPVYPLDILTKIREKRSNMIQTSSQYRFVCESVLKVFDQGIIRPLPEFNSNQPISITNRNSSLLIPWLQNEKNMLCT